MPLSVVIADDEAAARARLRRFMSDEPDVQIVAECEDGKSAVAAVLEHRPDLVFLDVRMPELNGFQVLDSVPRDTVPHFVFVTAFKDYALDAFAVDALDYLLKPFDAARFKATLRRARQRIADRADRTPLLEAIHQLGRLRTDLEAAVARLPANGGTGDAPATLDRITVKADGRVMFVKTTDVDFIESAANYVRLHVGPQMYSVREKIGTLADRLDRKQFARIHRTTIVNIDRIREVQPWFSGDAIVILRDGKKLRLSRLYRRSLAL
ncbi:MAG: LytR/AlgR family response regulator transcription factor [Gemmatimonadaceae bacterium]